MGLEQASCALVGAQLGKNFPGQAMIYYKSFQVITFWMTVISTLMFYTYRENIIRLYTDIDSI